MRVAHARNHTTENGRTSCAAPRKAMLEPLGSRRRSWGRDGPGGWQHAGSRGHDVMITGKLTSDEGQNAARGEALAGAAGRRLALRHRCAVWHGIGAWAIGHAAVVDHSETRCAIDVDRLLHALTRLTHRKSGHRRERQGQGDEESQ